MLFCISHPCFKCNAKCFKVASNQNQFGKGRVPMIFYGKVVDKLLSGCNVKPVVGYRKLIGSKCICSAFYICSV